MMTAALLMVTGAALLVSCGALPLEENLKVSGAATFLPEAPCSQQGGMCVRAAECPAGALHNTTGLCPQQQPLGVECCYGLSVRERRCTARGGICRQKLNCGRALWVEHAEDCGSTETCCALV